MYYNLMRNKDIKNTAGDMVWRCTSEEEAPSGIYWYILRTGTPYSRKVGSYIGTDVEE